MIIVETKKFIIRTYQKSDEDSIVENINNKMIHENTLTIPYPYTKKDAREWINSSISQCKRKNPESLSFVIEINGKAVGSIGFDQIEKEHKAELGYWLGEKYWGAGVMTKAVNEIVKYGFNELKLKRICAGVFSFNKGSMRVLEKAGFELEGILKKNVLKNKKFIDEYLYAKMK